jgi:glycosyltransferase involved in cell wall biosynthesis
VTAVHVVVPEGIDDPARPSGGNAYDRRVCHELAALGWEVHEHAVPGAWPRRGELGNAALGRTLGRIADGAAVLLDGLIASTAPEVLVPHAHRLRQVVLVHMPLGHRPPGAEADDVRARERDVLGAAASVITTSAWTRRRLGELYELPPERVRVAEPGVDAAELAPGTAAGGSLLCVGAVTPGKGHDVLIDALARIADLSWRCECVGSLDRDPGFADRIRRRALSGRLGGGARETELGDRVRFLGPRVGPDLDRWYAAADLLVLPSRAETYGMVVTEALARGVPVVACDVGGVTEALGRGDDGTRPGFLVPPEDPAALAAALRDWLENAELRDRLRRAARERRARLSPWAATATAIADVLAEVAASAKRVAGSAGNGAMTARRASGLAGAAR